MSDTFSETFDSFFQKHYVAHLLKDSDFLQQVRGDITADIFESEVNKQLTRLILGFYDENKSAPGELILTELNEFKDHIPDAKLLPLLTYIKELFDIRLQNRNYLLSQHNKFLRHQKLRQSFPQFHNCIKQGNLDQAEEVLKEIVTFKPSVKQSVGLRMDVDPSERILRRSKEETEKFWLLIPEIDRTVEPLGRGELGVWQSQRSSSGKTASLVHCIKAFVLQGFKVLVFTLEEGEEKYQDRIDMCISGLRKDNLTDYYTLQKSMRRWFKNGGDVLIKQFPSKLTKISDLRAHKTFIENTANFVADVIIVDYADELNPESVNRYANSFTTGGEVYSMLRGWAIEDNVCIWTAMQSNRQASQELHADMEHAGGSIAKIWIADLIISINRTPEEAKQKLTRLFIVKNRSGVAQFERTIRSDFDIMHFYKITGE